MPDAPRTNLRNFLTASQAKGTGTRFIAAEEAVAAIPDGATVAVTGVGFVLVPRSLLNALEARFLRGAHPRDLTVLALTTVGAAAGLFGKTGAGYGLDQFAHEGMIRRLVTSNLQNDWYPALAGMILANEIECYMLPMGSLIHAVREQAGGRPGFLSEVGLGSFVDPRVEGVGQNPRSREPYVQVMRHEGRDLLFYRSIPVDVALIRASAADEAGNLGIAQEPLRHWTKYLAMAAKNSGGMVIAQVKHRVPAGAIPAKAVEVPGVLVDRIVVDEHQQQLEDILDYTPALSGEHPLTLAPPAPLPFDVEKVIMRRAALEVRQGDCVNCGFRLPQQKFGPLALEENINDLIHISIEHGVLGGWSLGGILHWNPTSFLSSNEIFDLYDGGWLNVALLSFGEVDQEGNVNLTRFADFLAGPGGALDIAHRAPTVVFNGTFTTGGLEAEIADGRLRITREGRTVRFVKKAYQVTFPYKERLRKGQRFLIVTERGVFELREHGPVLIEVAPGIDLERDILAQAQFPISVDPHLRTMDPGLFRPEPLGLRERLLKAGARGGE